MRRGRNYRMPAIESSVRLGSALLPDPHVIDLHLRRERRGSIPFYPPRPPTATLRTRYCGLAKEPGRKVALVIIVEAHVRWPSIPIMMWSSFPSSDAAYAGRR